jgi:hypothetical protein
VGEIKRAVREFHGVAEAELLVSRRGFFNDAEERGDLSGEAPKKGQVEGDRRIVADKHLQFDKQCRRAAEGGAPRR